MDIDLTLKDKQVIKLLEKRLKQGSTLYAREISEIIVGYMRLNNQAIPDLLFTMLGQFKEPLYKIGDTLRINISAMTGYWWREDKNREALLIDADDCITVTVVDIDMFKNPGIDVTGKIAHYQSGLVEEREFLIYEDWIFDVKNLARPNMDLLF